VAFELPVLVRQGLAQLHKREGEVAYSYKKKTAAKRY